MSDFMRTLALTALVSLAANQLVLAAQPGAVEVKNVAELEVKTVKDGKTVLQRMPVKSAVPDSEIVYTTTFKNMITKPVANIVIENPVPPHSIYKSGSATGDNTQVSFSIDGGKNYAAPEKLTVKANDGKERVATPAEYTHIRWLVQGSLAAGASGQVGFRSVVK